jgi:hypothetical protein
MRATLSFWTSTATTAAEWPLSTTSHRVEVLGWEPASRRVYTVDHSGDRRTLLVMATDGEHAGNPLPLSADGARIDALRGTLVPMTPAAPRGWDLTTRVVQRRGLRLAAMSTPIRKFALGLTVMQRTGGITVGVGKATVTAYLRPRAVIECVYSIPGESLSVAMVTFCGVPAGIGFDKQTPILVTPLLQ